MKLIYLTSALKCDSFDVAIGIKIHFFRVQGYKVGLKIDVKQTKSLRLGISEEEKVKQGNEKIDQVDSFSYLGNIISKDSGSSEDIKSRIVKAQGVFSQLKKSVEKQEDKSSNQDQNIGSYSDDSGQIWL